MITLKKLTVQQIAKGTGVSTATVSRVLRDMPGVSPELSERVKAFLSDHDEAFRPRVMVKHKMTRIALVAYKSEPVVDYFSAMALSGMSRFAFDYAIDVSVLMRPPELLDVPSLVGVLRDHQADAAIISYLPNDKNFLAELKAYQSQIGIPMVSCFSDCEFLPSVIEDKARGEFELARHLLDLGHRKIGYLGASHDLYEGGSYNRLNSLRTAAAQVGVEIKDEWIALLQAKPFTLQGYFEIAKALLNKNPDLTALFCYNDDIALSVIKACRSLGLRVPEDISVTGFDGSPYSSFCYPELTTFCVDAEQVAHEATRLCYVMCKGLSQPSKTTIVPGKLILGESTAPPSQ